MFINSVGKKKLIKESVNQIIFQTSKLKVFLKNISYLDILITL